MLDLQKWSRWQSLNGPQQSSLLQPYSPPWQGFQLSSFRQAAKGPGRVASPAKSYKDTNRLGAIYFETIIPSTNVVNILRTFNFSPSTIPGPEIMWALIISAQSNMWKIPLQNRGPRILRQEKTWSQKKNHEKNTRNPSLPFILHCYCVTDVCKLAIFKD